MTDIFVGNDPFVLSDIHFNHTNIIKYCDRPFTDVNHMNEVIIKNWNETVLPDDYVVFGGDFCMTKHLETVKLFKDRLLGNILLIQGNHDYLTKTKYLEAGFIDCVKKFELGNVIFQHYPMKERVKDKIIIHGHIHNKTVSESIQSFNINVSVEVMDYQPKRLSEVLKLHTF